MERAARCPDHGRRRELPRISERPNDIPPAQGEKQFSRPLVRQAEHHLDGGIAAASLLALSLQLPIFLTPGHRLQSPLFRSGLFLDLSKK
jgi:hypothetical protein